MRVALSGGTGSLGSALIARLAADGAERIVTFSRDEQKRLALEALYGDHPGVKVYAGDIRDAERLPDIFRGVEVVIHCAARKVVSGASDEPREMLLTNVLGTVNVVAAARKAGVGRVLFISSDKAVQAENVYGVSKAMAEHLVLSENARAHADGTRLSVLRYGNVLGSNGSVLKVWRAAVAAGQPLAVTDTRMTRFWMTLPMAVDAVLAALGVMRGGEVFVPDLKAAPLVALAQAVGGEGYAVTSLGIRPGGEKLHESLVSADEARRTVRRNGFYIVTPPRTPHLWDASPWLGDPVAPGFTYRSDTWTLQWTAEALRELIGGQS